MTDRRRVVAGCLTLVLAVAAVVVYRWWDGRAPYGPEALGARVTLELVDQATADAAVAPVNAFIGRPGDQVLVGRVTWTAPVRPRTRTTLWIVLVDTRNDRTPTVFAVLSPRKSEVFGGWHGAINPAVDPWLGSEYRTGVGASPDASPVTFQTVLLQSQLLRHGQPPIVAEPAGVGDLKVLLVCQADSGKVHWTRQLPV